MGRHSSVKAILNAGSSTKRYKFSSSKSESWFTGGSGLSIIGRKPSYSISSPDLLIYPEFWYLDAILPLQREISPGYSLGVSLGEWLWHLEDILKGLSHSSHTERNDVCPHLLHHTSKAQALLTLLQTHENFSQVTLMFDGDYRHGEMVMTCSVHHYWCWTL